MQSKDKIETVALILTSLAGIIAIICTILQTKNGLDKNGNIDINVKLKKTMHTTSMKNSNLEINSNTTTTNYYIAGTSSNGSDFHLWMMLAVAIIALTILSALLFFRAPLFIALLVSFVCYFVKPITALAHKEKVENSEKLIVTFIFCILSMIFYWCTPFAPKDYYCFLELAATSNPVDMMGKIGFLRYWQSISFGVFQMIGTWLVLFSLNRKFLNNFFTWLKRKNIFRKERIFADSPWKTAKFTIIGFLFIAGVITLITALIDFIVQYVVAHFIA